MKDPKMPIGTERGSILVIVLFWSSRHFKLHARRLYTSVFISNGYSRLSAVRYSEKLESIIPKKQ